MHYNSWVLHALLLPILGVACVSAAAAAEPAMVSKVGGKDVTWQSGETSSAPRVQTLLSAGDRLTAGKGSFIEVEYLADGCTVRVKAGGSITIGDTSPCAAAASEKAAPAAGETSSTAAAAPPDARIIPAATGAVEVTEKNGPITRVNRGEGLVDASVGDALKAGDEVFAGANSSVTLYFAVPGCSHTVPAGTVYTVTSTAPCEAPAAAQNGAAAATPGAVPTAAIIGGGVAVAGAIAIVAVIANSDDGGNNNNNPATPD